MRKRNIDQVNDVKYNKNKKSKKDSDDEYIETTLTDSLSSLSLSDEELNSNYEEENYKFFLKEEIQDIKEFKPLSNELLELCKHMEEKKITLIKILKSQLTSYEKERAIELYGILKNTEPNTFDYLELCQMLQNMIEGPLHQSCTLETKEKLEILENKLRSENPTLDKIMNATISDSDKMMATQLYYMFYNEQQYSYEWFSLRKKINDIIDKPINITEHLELQKQEALIKQFEYQELNIKNKILMLEADLKIKKKLLNMYEQMVNDEEDKIKNKLNWLIQLPYQKITKPIFTNKNEYFKNIYHKLNSKIYGMEQVKEKILLYINNQLNQPNGKGNILALKGDPGVGKTKLVKVLADAVEQPYAKLSFGGAVDSTLLIGHDQGWSGSSPGMIMQNLARTKCANTIMLLDEIDKLSSSSKGKEVQAALLHVLDPTQSTSFNDAYLNEFPHDISRVWFIATMNSDDHLDPALKDRLEIIHVPSYHKEDMVKIIMNHTLPETCEKCGLKPNDLSIAESACYLLLNRVDKSSGMRMVEKEIYNIVSKISFVHHVKGDEFNLTFNIPNFNSLPYVIEKKTIKSLIKTKVDKSYMSMYI